MDFVPVGADDDLFRREGWDTGTDEGVIGSAGVVLFDDSLAVLPEGVIDTENVKGDFVPWSFTQHPSNCLSCVPRRFAKTVSSK